MDRLVVFKMRVYIGVTIHDNGTHHYVTRGPRPSPLFSLIFRDLLLFVSFSLIGESEFSEACVSPVTANPRSKVFRSDSIARVHARERAHAPKPLADVLS